MPGSEPNSRRATRRWSLLGLVLGLLWWGYAYGAWPLIWSLVIEPSLDQARPGITALIYERPAPGGKPQSSLSLDAAQAALEKPDTSLRAFAVWLVPAPGAYALRLACDDAGTLRLDGRTWIAMEEGIAADRVATATIELSEGPHLLEVELRNGPERGFFRLEVQAPDQEGWSLLSAGHLRHLSLGNFTFWSGLVAGAESARGWGLGGAGCLLILLGLGCLGLPRPLAIWACLAATMAGALADVYLERGRSMTEAACAQYTVLGELRKFQLYLRSPQHLEARASKAGLVLVGDSGHNLYPGSGDHQLFVLQDLVRERGQADRVEVYGMAHPGFHAYDYYFLLNRVVSERPRLFVAPINIRTFGNISRKYWFDEVYGLIRWSELIRPGGLSTDQRSIPFNTLLAAKLEASLLDGWGLPFLQVARTLFKTGRDMLEQGYRAQIKGFTGWDRWMGPPSQRADRLGAEWAEVTPDHHLMPVYQRLSRLAAAEGITVLYYAVPMNPSTKDLRPNFVRDSMAVLAKELDDPPRAHFLDLSALPLGEENFVDAIEHYSPAGKRVVAQELWRAARPLLEKRSD